MTRHQDSKLTDDNGASLGGAVKQAFLLFIFAASIAMIFYAIFEVSDPQWACNHIEVTTTQCDIAMGAR